MVLVKRSLISKTGKGIFKFQETEKGMPLLHPRQMLHLLLNKKGEKMPAKAASTFLSFLKKAEAAFAFQLFDTVPDGCCWIKPCNRLRQGFWHPN